MNRIIIQLCAFLLSYSLYSQTIKINEFMASNATTISDSFGDFDDWIELYNYSHDTVDIGGLYITDKLDIPTKHQIPVGFAETKIPPKGYIVLWADNDSLQNGPLHLNFKLSATGEALGLFATDGFTAIDSLSFGQQITDISYGRFPDGNDNWVFFNYPTPNASNSLTTIEDKDAHQTLFLFPNPVVNNVIYFSTPIDFQLVNLNGLVLSSYTQATSLQTHTFAKGYYFIITKQGEKIKILIL